MASASATRVLPARPAKYVRAHNHSVRPVQNIVVEMENAIKPLDNASAKTGVPIKLLSCTLFVSSSYFSCLLSLPYHFYC